jgi:hypothetical protein
MPEPAICILCLSTLRIPKRWTQKAVAVEVGVARNTVSVWFSKGEAKDMHSVKGDITHTRPDARHKINPTHKPIIAKLSDRQIAEHVGVAPTTVGKHRKELTVKDLQSDTRTGRDGRTINTANIGSKPKLWWKICHHKPAKAYEELAKERQRGGQGGVLLKENLPEANGQSRDQAGEAMNVSGRSVGHAKVVIANGNDELNAAVDADKLGMSTAAVDRAANLQRLHPSLAPCATQSPLPRPRRVAIRSEELAKERQGSRTDISENLHEGSYGRATDQAGEAMNVSGRSVSHAKVVIANGNEHRAATGRAKDRFRKIFRNRSMPGRRETKPANCWQRAAKWLTTRTAAATIWSQCSPSAIVRPMVGKFPGPTFASNSIH